MTGTHGGAPLASVGTSGRYVLGDLIGRGGAADIFRARDTSLARDVAVKLFPAGAAEADLARQRHEVQILAGLNHPGVVAVHDVGHENGRHYFVMQLIEGDALAVWIRRGPLRVEDVIPLGATIGEILGDVHRHGVVHCDVKPGNVLLDSVGRPHLADFGIAITDESSALAPEGLVIGTASYMSPEQVRGQPLGPPSDVYQLGLVLLECITGRREYPGPALEAAVARLHRPPDVPIDLPVPLHRLLVAMTRDEPTERPTTQQLVGELHMLARSPRPPAAAPSESVVGNGVFISYRRAASWHLARLVHGYLSAQGFDVFMDVENLGSGDFESRVLTEIGHRRHFVVVLQPTTRLEPSDRIDWMRREIARAFQLGRNVVPVMSDGFTFSGTRLPADIERLATSNGVTVYPDYFDEAMSRLHRRFLHPR